MYKKGCLQLHYTQIAQLVKLDWLFVLPEVFIRCWQVSDGDGFEILLWPNSLSWWWNDQWGWGQVKGIGFGADERS